MKHRFAVTIGAVLAISFLCGCQDPEPIEREVMPDVGLRAITPEQLLHLARNRTKPLRLRTTSDVLPGGLSAAMAPLIIDWKASQYDRPDGFLVVHNLNYGGNPLEGTTVLQSIKIPLDGVEKVEWILVPLSKGGRKAPIHHGQLRFVFRPDRPVELLDLIGQSSGGDAHILDLVISWEAWREPGHDYDVFTGMDPAAYRLGLRLFAGPQRFLEDALGGRDWFATTLRMPGGSAGLAELLKVTLAMGDGLARHTLYNLLDGEPEEWLTEAPVADHEALIEKWRELQKIIEPRLESVDSRLNIPPAERNYQTVLRSCATVAYYNIIVAVQRLREAGHDDGVVFENLDQVSLGGDEPWMKEVSTANLGGLVMRTPAALRWVRANPYAVPAKIPGRLDKAGLVLHEDGKPVEVHYRSNGTTPYGLLEDNLIR